MSRRSKAYKKIVRQERRNFRKHKACHNCRYRVWTDRPLPENPCGGCVDYYGVFGHWKRRRFWQLVRDFFEYRGLYKRDVRREKKKEGQE